MKKINLASIGSARKIGDVCEYIEPNILEDSLFLADGEPIGFYLTRMPEKMCKLADLADKEFNSNRVPKTVLARRTNDGVDAETGKYKYKNQVFQKSTILGAVPPKPHMRRGYKTISSAHREKSAETFIKAMLLLALESEKIIQQYLPKQYETQKELFEKVPKEYRFGNLFTSSISNYNISAPFHIDRANIPNTVNVIICKKKNAVGGDLHIPEYGATIGQQDNSILVYPAWRDMHAVTPITPTKKGGYRNSLIFYPLNAFIEDGK